MNSVWLDSHFSVCQPWLFIIRIWRQDNNVNQTTLKAFFAWTSSWPTDTVVFHHPITYLNCVLFTGCVCRKDIRSCLCVPRMWWLPRTVHCLYRLQHGTFSGAWSSETAAVQQTTVLVWELLWMFWSSHQRQSAKLNRPLESNNLRVCNVKM